MKTNKLHSLLGVTILALAGSIAASSSANATVTAVDGDLFIGFRATSGTGASQDYLIDIGQASIYRDATSSFVLNIGNIGADLTSIFGSNWSTRSDVLWEVIGAQKAAAGIDGTNTEYASKSENVLGTHEAPWAARSNSLQGNVTSAIFSMSGAGAATGYNSYTSTANSNVGIIQNIGDASSYNSFQIGVSGHTTAFGFYTEGTAPAANFEGNFGNGAAGTALDLFRMTNTTTGGGTSSYLGNFTADSSGNITFHVASVPEPASLAMLGLGGFALGLVRRRKVMA